MLAACAALLSKDEHDRLARLRVPAARHDALVTRALVRRALSAHVVGVDPRAWIFRTGRHGRPEIASPAGGPRLRFNVSHTSGLVVVGITPRRAIGVDVEDLGRQRRADAVADRFFAPLEAARLRALAPAARRRRFIAYWTLKEAYVKARGLGLRLPLAHFWFHLDGRGRARIAFDARLRDDPRRWRFALLRPTRRHVLAVAVARAPGTRVRLHLHGAPAFD
jgi:4'-phosphopantetheinyl transferase